jgi:peptidoglycan L-alanyl-D-glutamate endopeptidase CwlK
MTFKADKQLFLLYPYFRYLLVKVMAEMEMQGLPIRVTETIRSFKRQEEFFTRGRETGGEIITNARPGLTPHHYGVAADVCFQGKDPYPNRSTPEGKLKWDKLVKIVENHGLESGARFSGIHDFPHVQRLYGHTMNHIFEAFKSGGMLEVWRRFDRHLEISRISADYIQMAKMAEEALNA